MSDTSAAAEHLALALTQAGMQRMSARVWAAVLCADQEAVTAGELAERLGVSAGAVSGAVKTLLTAGLIERVPAPGSRREHYGFPSGAWVRTTLQREGIIEDMRRAAEEGLKSAEPGGVAARRLAEMRDFYAFLIAESKKIAARWDEERRRLGYDRA